MSRRLNVMLDDDAAVLLRDLTTERRQGAYLSQLIRAAHASTAQTTPTEASEPPAPPVDLTAPIRYDAYQVATELNVLTNRLMEIAEQPTRAVWTRIDG